MIKLIDLEVYKKALEIGNRVWKTVDKWDYFNKDTLGKQFVRAADSMALNIAEGYVRFFIKKTETSIIIAEAQLLKQEVVYKKPVKES